MAQEVSRTLPPQFSRWNGVAGIRRGLDEIPMFFLPRQVPGSACRNAASVAAVPFSTYPYFFGMCQGAGGQHSRNPSAPIQLSHGDFLFRNRKAPTVPANGRRPHEEQHTLRPAAHQQSAQAQQAEAGRGRFRNGGQRQGIDVAGTSRLISGRVPSAATSNV